MAGATAPAQAQRTLITKNGVDTESVPGGLEGACGVALTGGKIYVSDYYHHAIAVFDDGGTYLERIAGNPLNGPCQLATSAGGALYANDWHESVGRVLTSNLELDSEESTGVAVDQASGDVYVNDRTYVAVYEPSGAPVLAEGGEPLRIGLGTLGDAYGIAVAGGKVYVPDAADDTVKVYEPATDPGNPVAVIDGAATPQGRFVSLVDASVAVDPSNGHLVVLDNLQPGFEFPQGAIEEFDAAGNFLGQLNQKVIHGGPGGLAFEGGILYATSGNSEESAVFKFGAYTGAGALAAPSAVTPEPAVSASSFRPAADQGAAEVLRVVSASTAGDGTATIAVMLPAAGTVVAGGKRLRPLRRRAGAGRRVLRLHPDRAGRRALLKAGQLKVRARIAFTPDAGAALHATKTLILATGGGGAR
jgi:DNA-binding beta-propeller fold protein YncE